MIDSDMRRKNLTAQDVESFVPQAPERKERSRVEPKAGSSCVGEGRIELRPVIRPNLFVLRHDLDVPPLVQREYLNDQYVWRDLPVEDPWQPAFVTAGH